MFDRFLLKTLPHNEMTTVAIEIIMKKLDVSTFKGI